MPELYEKIPLKEGLTYGEDFYREDLKPGMTFTHLGNSRRGETSGTIKKVNRKNLLYMVWYMERFELEIKTSLADLDGAYIKDDDNLIHVFHHEFN